MTTKNPRLTITLKPALAAQLREMARLTGNSQSSLIAELLDGSHVVFDRLIQVLSAAEGAKHSLKGKITGDVSLAQTRMEEQLGIVLEMFDEATQPVLDGFEEISRRAGKSSIRGVVTPPSNRGVRSKTKQAKTIAPTSSPSKQKAAKLGGGRHGSV